jgi:uncharacterized protein YjbJ (UPF0337 family)
MILFHRTRKFLTTLCLVVLISTVTVFGFASEDSWAATLRISSIHQPHIHMAWGWGKAKVVTKDIEGKTQEAIGNIIDSPKTQAMGRAKQVESQARDAAEDVEKSMKLKGQEKVITKNIEGKLQELAGNSKD